METWQLLVKLYCLSNSEVGRGEREIKCLNTPFSTFRPPAYLFFSFRFMLMYAAQSRVGKTNLEK